MPGLVRGFYQGRDDHLQRQRQEEFDELTRERHDLSMRSGELGLRQGEMDYSWNRDTQPLRRRGLEAQTTGYETAASMGQEQYRDYVSGRPMRERAAELGLSAAERDHRFGEATESGRLDQFNLQTDAARIQNDAARYSQDEFESRRGLRDRESDFRSAEFDVAEEAQAMTEAARIATRAMVRGYWPGVIDFINMTQSGPEIASITPVGEDQLEVEFSDGQVQVASKAEMAEQVALLQNLEFAMQALTGVGAQPQEDGYSTTEANSLRTAVVALYSRVNESGQIFLPSGTQQNVTDTMAKAEDLARAGVPLLNAVRIAFYSVTGPLNETRAEQMARVEAVEQNLSRGEFRSYVEQRTQQLMQESQEMASVYDQLMGRGLQRPAQGAPQAGPSAATPQADLPAPAPPPDDGRAQRREELQAAQAQARDVLERNQYVTPGMMQQRQRDSRAERRGPQDLPHYTEFGPEGPPSGTRFIGPDGKVMRMP